MRSSGLVGARRSCIHGTSRWIPWRRSGSFFARGPKRMLFEPVAERWRPAARLHQRHLRSYGEAREGREGNEPIRVQSPSDLLPPTVPS
jgi:hypothetical protein